MIAEKAEYQFTQDWISDHMSLWATLFAKLPERKAFLEIGSYEGRASCFMLANGLDHDGTLICIDTWEGSPEFERLSEESRTGAFERFQHNIELARSEYQNVRVLKGTSYLGLAKLITENSEPFLDFIYIDGAHTVNDTLSDAVMSWPLLKRGGLMIFDDYLWNVNSDVQSRPKFAIDMFTALWNPYLLTIGCGNQYILLKR